jgi:hypothetical protein
MSSFSDLFSGGDTDTLPAWLQQGAELVDAGLDLYDRIGGGGTQPEPAPIQTQAPVAAGFAGLVSPGVLVIAGVALLLLLRKR